MNDVTARIGSELGDLLGKRNGVTFFHSLDLAQLAALMALKLFNKTEQFSHTVKDQLKIV